MRKLSIHIALHNRVQFIKDSILSALNCGYDDAAIIIFDDASSDNSGSVVKTLAKEYPGRIQYIRSDENVGCAKARAAMADAADSEYILVLDDDDILLPFDIAGQLRLLDGNPEIAASYGKVFLTDSSLKPLNMVMGGAYSRFILSYHTPVTHSAALIRRSDLLAAGNYEVPGTSTKSVAEDLFLWFKLSAKKDLHFDNSFRLLYRQHSVQSSSRKDAYLEASNFIHRNIIDNNKDIYERILSGKITAGPGEIKTVVILLSIISRYMQPDSVQRLQILNAAETLSPSDYGINAVKAEYFLEKKDYVSAIGEAEKILTNHPADECIRKTGLEKILKICRQTGADTNDLEKEINRLDRAYANLNFDISKFQRL